MIRHSPSALGKIREKISPECWHHCRVADPFHFRPDPDPANQNFKNRIRILLALTKNQFKNLKFFSHQTYVFLLIFEWWLFLSEKVEKFIWKCVKPLFLKYFFLVYTTLHCQSTNRIRIRWKFSGSGFGSGSYQNGPDPTGSGSATLVVSQYFISHGTISEILRLRLTRCCRYQ